VTAPVDTLSHLDGGVLDRVLGAVLVLDLDADYWERQGAMMALLRSDHPRGEEIVRLTDRERDMLRILSVSPGETVPRLALSGNGGSLNERAVDVQVNRLRRKIERDPANPLIVQTVRGIGYRLVLTP